MVRIGTKVTGFTEVLAMTIEEMKELKKSRGYSYEQIAEWSGIPLGTVQKIFSGVTRCPRYSTIQALENIFKEEKRASYDYQSESSEHGSFRIEENGVRYLAGKKQGEYTTEDYYALPNARRVELIDGVFYDMSPPAFVHQGVAGEIYRQIANFIRENKEECVTGVSPVDVRLDCDNRTMVQPDVLIVCDRSKIMHWGIMGAPDFVLEVLSPSTSRKDCIKKLVKYLEAGVREYWIIDPDKKKLVKYDLEEENMTPSVVCSLSGSMPVSIYQGRLEINLNLVAEMIEEYPEGGRDHPMDCLGK